MTTRRAFIKSGTLAAIGVGIGAVPAFAVRAVESFLGKQKTAGKKKVLICIFQRGAMDGLMAVTPFNDPYLKAARPGLFMTAARNGNANPLIDLDGRFGLHPAMAAFEPLFRQGQLAIIHGVGLTNATRSHFDAQDFMETGMPFEKGSSSGWLNRACGLLPKEASPFRAVSISGTLPRSLHGDYPTIAVENLSDFKLRNKRSAINLTAQSFEDLYDETTSGLLQQTGKETFEAIDMISKLDLNNYKAANGSVYPKSPLGNALKQLAQLIKTDVGLEIGFAESTGWDTHFNQGTINGPFARHATDLSQSIAAFWADLGADWQEQVVVMTMTEFGRTVRQNGSSGTDHGRGSCSFLLGHDIRGGLVHGMVPVLSEDLLEDKRDLPVTTDFRSVFSEIVSGHLSLPKTDVLFPGWKEVPLNLIRSSSNVIKKG
jgi:uncharacterized protein (DUF1501 family)